MAAANLFASPPSGRLVASRGARLPLVGAATSMFAAALITTTFTSTTSVYVHITAYVLVGLGLGLVNSPITDSAGSGMPQAQAGVASAVATTSRQVGDSVGVAVFGSILASAAVAGTATTTAAAGTTGAFGSFIAASHVCWWVAAGCAALIGALGIITTGPRARTSAERTAAVVAAAGVPANMMEMAVR